MNDYINIQDKQVIFTANKLQINVLYLELNNLATISVKLFSSDNKLLQSDDFILSGSDYLNWHDDDYLIEYVCDKYGYTLSVN